MTADLRWLMMPVRESSRDSHQSRPGKGPPSCAGTASLPNSSAASIELFDVAGRRITYRNVGSLGAGSHTLDLGEAQSLAAGMYLVRLKQSADERVTRVTVLP
jgi:hypothetical protein